MNLSQTIEMFKRDLTAEVGYPMAGNTGTGNLVEPQPKNDVPSLRKSKRARVLSDDDEEQLEEKVMPDAARERKELRERRIGKSGAQQTF